ncbi:MAG: hypothetical protein K0S36_1480 [Nitrosospira multiformis]|jgi:hypothetical protein|nr:hypothetical protein [Nitrosospira multiformis]
MRREYMGVVETTTAISDGKCYSAWTRQVINRTGFNMFWESWRDTPIRISLHADAITLLIADVFWVIVATSFFHTRHGALAERCP